MKSLSDQDYIKFIKNKQTNNYADLTAFINQLDVFYLNVIFEHFRVKRNEIPTAEEMRITHYIQILKKYGYLQVCGKKGCFVQFILVKKIPLLA